MAKLAIILIVCTFIVLVVIFLIGLAANQHEDDTVWLDSFMDQCTPTEKNKALAERELDMLRYKISNKRFEELLNKFKYTFK
jgi:FtsZ-interacting cell division protein ZipA